VKKKENSSLAANKRVGDLKFSDSTQEKKMYEKAQRHRLSTPWKQGKKPGESSVVQRSRKTNKYGFLRNRTPILEKKPKKK